MPSILFVCTANQIRSPIAAEYFKSLIEKQQIPGEWLVDSAGTWAFTGAPATPLAVQIGHENGISLENHKSKSISLQLLQKYDLILVMEHRHKEALDVEFPETRNKVQMLTFFTPNNHDIPDPVAGSEETYRIVASEIFQVIDRGLGKITQMFDIPWNT